MSVTYMTDEEIEAHRARVEDLIERLKALRIGHERPVNPRRAAALAEHAEMRAFLVAQGVEIDPEIAALQARTTIEVETFQPRYPAGMGDVARSHISRVLARQIIGDGPKPVRRR